jgi:hypothetical protein
LVHSPPIRAPFSATERFIKKTKNVAASMTTANSQKGTKRRRDRASELTDRREHYPPMSEQNANFLEVLIGQMAESVKIYGVFSKSPRILGHAELFQPASDQIGTSSAPRVANTHQRASNRLSASVVAWLLDRG